MRPVFLLAAATLLFGHPAAIAQGRDGVLATGSSTVAPFTRAVAAALAEGRQGPRAEIRSVGTVWGFTEFCQGIGPRYADIQNASRRINLAEVTQCASRGVHEILELPIGYDGIVVAYQRDLAAMDLTREELWRGLAREVPGPAGRLVANPHRTWRDVSARLPDWPIRVIGPPATSGTRDSFEDLALIPGCLAVREIAAMTEGAARRRICVSLRDDGAWVDGGEDDDLIVRQVTQGAPGTLGVFGFSFLDRHRAQIRAATVEGVTDSRETIATGRYPLSRPLFLYVKRRHMEMFPFVAAFLDEYVSDRAMGPNGYLQQAGLVPLDRAGIQGLREMVTQRAVMTRRPER